MQSIVRLNNRCPPANYAPKSCKYLFFYKMYIIKKQNLTYLSYKTC